jgi:hypothetical protein
MADVCHARTVSDLWLLQIGHGGASSGTGTVEGSISESHAPYRA